MTATPGAPSGRWTVLLAFGLMLLGCGIIVVMPSAWKGPILFPINEDHAVRLADALGIVLATGAWLWMNALETRRREARRAAARKLQKGRK